MRISETFQQKLSQAISENTVVLPSVPAIAARIGAAACDEDVTATSLAGEIADDPALAARLIRVANSALYRSRGQVDRLPTAITRIGIPATRRLVMALSLEQALKPSHPALQGRVRSAWMRSVEVAALARVLASHFSSVDPEEAMLAGLVHRIGVLPILSMAGEMPTVLKHTDVLDATIGAWQATVGKILLGAWHFPATIIAIPESAQDVERTHVGSADLGDVVSVARLHSQSAAGKSPEDFDYAAVPAYRKLGFSPDLACVLLSSLGDEVAEARGLLN